MVPVYPLWLPVQLLSRGGRGGRARKAGACSLGRVVGWRPRGWSWARRCSSWDSGLFPRPSSPLITHAHWRRGSIFCFFASSLSLSCVVPPGGWSLFLHAGEREKQKRFSVISSAVPCRTLGSSLGWFGVMPGASGGRSSGCWPLWPAGVFNRGGVGEGMSCWMGPSPPPCERERGLSCLGFSEGGRRESLNGEMNKTLSLTLLSVRH